MQPVIIVEGGAELAAADAVARGPLWRSTLRAMRRITARFSVEWSFRGPAGILAELHVQPPMRGVLNRRMAAHGGGESVLLRERAQEIPTFRTGLSADEAGGLDPPDRLESGLVRSGVQPVDAVAQRVTADLDPAVVFLHGVLSR